MTWDAIVSNVVALPALEEHLSECEERYQAVIQRLDTLDTRMTRIELLSLDIKALLLNNVNAGHYDS